MRVDGRMQAGMVGMQNPALLCESEVGVSGAMGVRTDEPQPGETPMGLPQINAMTKEKVIKDAISGQVLEKDLVEQARREELEYFESKNVWYKRPRSEAFQKMGKAPISVKWVDVNKGDDVERNYRSRVMEGTSNGPS